MTLRIYARVSIEAGIGYTCIQLTNITIGHLCGFGCRCPSQRREFPVEPSRVVEEVPFPRPSFALWPGQPLERSPIAQFSAGDADICSTDNYERLSALDNSFLVLERANTPMHVGSAAVFDAAPLLGPGGRRRLRTLRAARRFTPAPDSSLPSEARRTSRWKGGPSGSTTRASICTTTCATRACPSRVTSSSSSACARASCRRRSTAGNRSGRRGSSRVWRAAGWR